MIANIKRLCLCLQTPGCQFCPSKVTQITF